MNMNINNNDSAVGRGIRTAIQALGGFIIGLAIAIWQVPGVADVVKLYVSQHFVELVIAFGIPSAVGSGVLGFLWNFFRKDVPNV